MGLDCSHDAFHGAYSSFNRFRQAVARALGGSFSPHEDKTLDENTWYWGNNNSKETNPGLYVFFMHSDCDGEISPEHCALIANEMTTLLPALDAMGLGSGHILSNNGYGEVARRFIAGCVLAHNQNEPLEFH